MTDFYYLVISYSLIICVDFAVIVRNDSRLHRKDVEKHSPQSVGLFPALSGNEAHCASAALGPLELRSLPARLTEIPGNACHASRSAGSCLEYVLNQKES